MEQAIEKLWSEIEGFLTLLCSKRKAYYEVLDKGEILASTKKILQEIKQLEEAIATLVDEHFRR